MMALLEPPIPVPELGRLALRGPPPPPRPAVSDLVGLSHLPQVGGFTTNPSEL